MVTRIDDGIDGQFMFRQETAVEIFLVNDVALEGELVPESVRREHLARQGVLYFPYLHW